MATVELAKIFKDAQKKSEEFPSISGVWTESSRGEIETLEEDVLKLQWELEQVKATMLETICALEAVRPECKELFGDLSLIGAFLEL